MSLNSSVQMPTTFPSIQLLGLEMLLHYFLGPEVITTAAKNKLILSLGESQGYALNTCRPNRHLYIYTDTNTLDIKHLAFI